MENLHNAAVSILMEPPAVVNVAAATAKAKAAAEAKAKKCTYCYAAESDDSRCCGACYYCCPSKHIQAQCNVCPNTFCDYWQSGYIQTTSGPKRESQDCPDLECEDCCCTCVCCPFKFPFFFPCLLGALCNGSLNTLAGTHRNYLL